MTKAADWQEIERLFFVALDLPADERSAFLTDACGERFDLRRRVDALLAASSAEEDVIEQVVGRAAAEIPPQLSSSDAPLARLGPYRIVRVLGEGGMGMVYLGERDDGAYQQQVAIKVVKEERLGLALRHRMRTERQILAQLNHPGIARLLDGGTADDGRPYLVMEYVEGETIDAYCDRARLSVRERLVLFCDVCAAVEYAHGHLVVHRDIKPANVMVTTEGRPKLLDFGIAKLLNEGVEHPGLTTLGQRVLTPAYASPEQLRDEPVTTAVDVYGLGVLLYRLLTGRSPYRVSDMATGDALRRAICEEAPARPSLRVVSDEIDQRAMEHAAARGVTPRQLSRQLDGDIDHILAKALRKEPKERYASVERLAEDLERHLEGLPIDARKGNRRYQLGRFVSRHRTALLSVVAATVAALLALSVGLVGQMREAERANREAEASAEVTAFLVDLWSASDPYKTREVVTAREMLDLGVARIERELVDRPLVQARLMGTMGQLYHTRGSFEEADALLQGALARWQQQEADHGSEVATAHLNLADNLRVLGRVEASMPHYEQALDRRLARFGETSLEVAEVRNNHALALIRQAAYPAAEAQLLAALAVRRRSPEAQYPLAQTLHNLTLIALRQGDYAEAAKRAAETLALKAEVLAPDHPSTGRTHLLAAQAARELGDLEGAERAFESALTILRPAFGDDHLSVLGAEGDRAYVRFLRAGSGAGTDARPEIEAEQRRVLAAKRARLGAGHVEVAISLAALAHQVGERGGAAEAEGLLREALAVRLARQGEAHPGVAGVRFALGELLHSAARLSEAEPLLRRALEVRRQTLAATHPDLGRAMAGLARLLADRQRCEEAGSLAHEALGILEADQRAEGAVDRAYVSRARAVIDACPPVPVHRTMPIQSSSGSTSMFSNRTVDTSRRVAA